uniref:Uncharacterized protein n=1 Tax=Raoultella phage vB_RorM-ISF6 TaxID=1470464 RepID=X2EXF9_9CAUD|nr:hypothetical protein [Raoultella phage vB_RorM-ISF6]
MLTRKLAAIGSAVKLLATTLLTPATIKTHRPRWTAACVSDWMSGKVARMNCVNQRCVSNLPQNALERPTLVTTVSGWALVQVRT